MIAYLRNRLLERSTWIGLAIAAACIALAWIYQEQIYTACVGLLALVRAGLPDRFLSSRIRAVLAPVQPATPPAQPPRSTPMSLVDDFKTAVEAAAENAAKAALKAAIASLPGPSQAAANAVVSAAESPTTANITVAVADILAVVEAALATVPAGYVPATLVDPPVQQPAA